MNYQAPTITGRQELQGSLADSEFFGGSDAAIKHGVEPVQSAYEAPAISAQREIDGSMQLYSLEENGSSDAAIKHHVEPVQSA